MKLSTLLAGKKTYVTAGVGAIGAAAMAATHQASPAQAGIVILGSLLATFLRSGQKAETAKQIAGIAEAVVPFVVALAPGAAAIAATVGAVAGQIAHADDRS